MQTTHLTTDADSPGRQSPVKHVKALDGLRGIAVLAVMAFHAEVPGFHLGFLGVELFFVLSGYLITTLLQDKFTRTGQIHLGKFWGRRVVRLMPAYWLYIGLLTVCIYLNIGWRSTQGGWNINSYVGSLWGYFVNLVPQFGIWQYQWLSLHLWSLAVEEQFYFIFPCLCFLFIGYRFFPVMISGLLISLFLCWFITIPSQPSLLHTRGVAILTGCVTAILCRRSGSNGLRRFLATSPVRVGLPCGIVVALVLFSTIWQVMASPGLDHYYYTVPPFAICFSLLVASVWLGLDSTTTAILSWKPLAYLGTISYGLYLYHMIAYMVVWHFVFTDVNILPASVRYGLRLIIYLTLTIGLATVSYYSYEKRFLDLKKYLR